MSSIKHLFDPIEFHDLVRDSIECVLDRRNKECRVKNNQSLHRTLVSRAYFSVFLRLREIFYPNLKDILGPEIHHQLIVRLRSEGYNDVADKLHKLRRMRNRADYDLDIFIDRVHVDYVFKIAQELHTKIDAGEIT